MAKNPNRVAAGKRAWKKMKAAGIGIAGGDKKKKSSSRSQRTSNPGGGSVSKRGPKLPSLAKSITFVGGAIIITGLGVDAKDGLIGEIDSMADVLGLGVTVTGIGVVAMVNLLKAIASFSPWFGRKYRGWLRGYGMRP